MRRPASRWLSVAVVAAVCAFIAELSCRPSGTRPNNADREAVIDTITHGGFTFVLERPRRDNWATGSQGIDDAFVTAGTRTVRITDGFLSVGDAESGEANPGDTIKLSLDGTLWVNGQPRLPLPLQPRTVHPGERVLDAPDLDVTSLAWSPSGRLLAAVGRADSPDRNGRFALVWDATTWQAAFTLDHPEPLVGVAFSPNGKMAATASTAGVIRLFDTNEGEPVHELKLDLGPNAPIAFLSDDWLIVEQIANLVAYPIGHPAGVAVELAKTQESNPGRSFVLSRDRSTIVVAEGDHMRVMRPKITADVCVPGLAAAIDRRAQVYAVSADGKRIATYDDRGPNLRIRDSESGQLLKRLHVRPERARPVSALAFSPDGTWLMTGDGEGFVSLYDIAAGREVCWFGVPARGVRQLEFSPDGKTIAGALRHGAGPGPKVVIWQLADFLPR